MRVVLASNNAKKLAELQVLLDGLGLELVPQSALGIAEADEPHATFIENALAKARQAAAACGGAALADDSGLCVDALGGAPGVISAHYAPLDGAVAEGGFASDGHGAAPAAAGRAAAAGADRAGASADPPPPGVGLPAGSAREALRRRQDAANNARLLAALHGVADRRARFVSTLVAVRHAADPEPLVAVGRWHGTIATAPRGAQGFGYDPLMQIDALGLTVAEMDAALKNRHSHRARAAQALRMLLQEAWHR